MPIRHYLALLFNRRQLATLLLGFSSGLPIALTASTLQAWYTVSGISIIAIGFLSLVGQPYTYKFLWAPFIDRYIPPLLGRRRGWIIITQIGLIAAIIAMASLHPQTNPVLLAGVALLVAFLSASQDIAIDAYRVDVLPPNERGFGVALTAGGYRIAMLVSGGLALILADHYGWRITYISMACLMLIGAFGAWFGPEPQSQPPAPKKLVDAIRDPFIEFMSRKNAVLLLFIVLYKLGDAFTISLNTTFLLRDIGFSLTDVGTVNKAIGFIAILVGSFLGGVLLPRMGLFRSLLWFGLAQACAGLLFIALAIVGKNYLMFVATVIIDNCATGMSTAVFVAWLMSMCDTRYSATQYALFSAVASIGRTFVGPAAGWMVTDLGWVHFYIVTFLLSFPGLALLWYLGKRMDPTFFQSNTSQIGNDDTVLEKA